MGSDPNIPFTPTSASISGTFESGKSYRIVGRIKTMLGAPVRSYSGKRYRLLKQGNRMKREYTNVVKANLEEIARLLDEGHTPTDLASRFGIHQVYLWHELIVLGLWKPQRMGSRFDKYAAIIRQMAAQDYSYKKIAQTVGGSETGIRTYIREHQIKKPNNLLRSQLECLRSEILQMREKGETYRQIGEKLCYSGATIYRFIDEIERGMR